MMAFFFTMPTSITVMPIIAITEKIHPEQNQRQDGAESGGGQAGKDRQGVNEALVQDAEHDVGRKDRRQDQDALPAQRILEDLRGALEAGRDRRRQALVALELLDRVDRLAERESRFEIERDRDRRLLALMADLQRPDRRHEPSHRAQRNDGPVRHAVAVDAGAPGPAGSAPVPPLVLVFRKILSTGRRRPVWIGCGLHLQDHLG